MKAFVLFAVAAIAALFAAGHASAAPGTSPKGLEVPIEKALIQFTTDVKSGGYKIVTTDELKKWLDEGKKMTIISSLPESDDKQLGTLPSAVNGFMPKNEKEVTRSDKENLLKAAGSDKGKTMVVYCGFVSCRRSHIAAKILVENGFQNVYRYPAGIIGWKETGYPLAK